MKVMFERKEWEVVIREGREKGGGKKERVSRDRGKGYMLPCKLCELSSNLDAKM